MTIYLHRFSGTLPAGDVFTTGWHSNSSNSLPTSHGLAVSWLTDLMAGTGGAAGLHADLQTLTVFTKVTTSQLNTVAPYNTVAVAETDVTEPGTGGTATLPQDLAVVVSLRTTDPSRKGRGRMYLPAPLAADLASNGELAAATVTSWINSLDKAWVVSNGAGEHPVVFSRTTGLSGSIIRFGIGTLFDRQSRRVNKVNTVRTFSTMP